MIADRPRLILVGSRLRAYREYALASLVDDYEIVLIGRDHPTWQREYVETHRVADTADAAALFPAVCDLRGEVPDAGILTWDESSVAAVAQVARKLGMRHLSPDAVQICRDKPATRNALRQAGLPEVRFRLARTGRQAAEAAEAIGFPVVVKPRSLAGSHGVSVAHDGRSLADAFRLASTSRLPGLDPGDGVLVEEYLEGPQIGVDCVVTAGVARPVYLTRKRLGPMPYVEQTGHLVAPWRHEPWAAEVTDLVEAAHRAVGADWGVTHTQVRLTPRGPRVVEINPCVSGDLIPVLGRAATGVDLVQAAAAIAFGREPRIEPTRDRVAEVRFLHPPHDGTVEQVALPAAGQIPDLVAAVALAAPGDALVLPPRAPTPRTAALLSVAETPQDTRRALDRAEDATVVRVTGGPDVRLGARLENAVTRRFFAAERDAAAMAVSGVRGVERFRVGAGGGQGLNRPVFLSAADRAGLEQDLHALFQLLQSIPRRLFGGDLRAFALAVGMSETQADLVLRGAGPAPLPLARGDLYRETTGFRLMELNTGSSLGGWQMGEFARALIRDEAFRDFAGQEDLQYPDPLAAITAVLRAAHPAVDAALSAGARPRLAITDWPDSFERGRCWMDFVVPAFEHLGFDTAVCHLGQLAYQDGEVLLDGRRVEVVYRMFIPGELPDEPATRDLIDPLLDAAARGRVALFAPLDSELYGNKGSLAILSDERNRAVFTEPELALIDRFLPWTRFVRDEATTRDGARIDLLEYALAEKDQLVLKPTLLYAGIGVIPGWTVDGQQWAAHLRAAVDGPYVLQQRVYPGTERFRADDGEGFVDMAVAFGALLVGGAYAGMLARAVPDPATGIVSMVNGAQIGCAFHVSAGEGA